MHDGTAEWRFIYDASNEIIGFIRGASTYYYVKNLQGDVIKILDNYCSEIVTYTYDSWGNVIAQGGSSAYVSLGQKNPIRYRGYFYDTDTGLYYLQSRYYNPQWGRFINADNQISAPGEYIQGGNLFSYCLNNPINKSDPTGNWPKWIGKAIAVVAVAVVVVAAVAITVSTFGAGSVAGVAAITTAVTIAARAIEVAALQVKKSISSGNNSGVKISSSNSSSSGNSSGGRNGSTGGNSTTSGGSTAKKSGGQVAVDVVEALFDNGLQIIGTTPFTKAVSIGGNHILNKQISEFFGETTTLSSTLSETTGKIFPYMLAAYAWYKTTISIFSDDPVQRAEDRGYTLN